jgi:hypothetical protein
MFKPSLGFSRTPPSVLVARARAVRGRMFVSPDFPSPPVTANVFDESIESLDAAIAAALDGGRKAFNERDRSQAILVSMMRKLGHYAEACAEGNVTILVSSGFDVFSTTDRGLRAALTEYFRKIVHGEKSGELAVWLAASPGALIYDLRWGGIGADGTVGSWESRLIPDARRAVVIDNLVPGTVYAFQVRILTKQGFGGFSDSVTKMCT